MPSACRCLGPGRKPSVCRRGRRRLVSSRMRIRSPVGPLAVAAAIVDDFADPDPPAVIDVDVRRAQEHRLAREQRCLQTRGDIEPGNGVFQFVCLIRRGSRVCQSRRWLPVEDEELNRAPAPLVGPAVVQTGRGPKPGVTGGKVETDDGGRMRADAVADRLAIDPQPTTARIGILADLAKSRRGFLPLQVGELLLARGTNEARFGPVGPVATDAVARVGDHEPQLLDARDVDLHLHRVTRRAGGDQTGCRTAVWDRPPLLPTFPGQPTAPKIHLTNNASVSSPAQGFRIGHRQIDDNIGVRRGHL